MASLTTDSPAAVNEAYFDEQAATYDARHGKLIERLTRELQSRLDFIGVDWASDDDDDDEEEDEDEGEGERKSKREVRLLDYACGTGMVSRALAPYLTQCVGIDISDQMVAVYNARAKNQGLYPSEMRAIQGDLCAASPAPADLVGFDLAAVGGGLHHFADPELAARRLAERLRPGGVLLVVDFLEHAGGHGGPGAHTVAHHGFSEARVRGMFEGAGAGGDFRLEVVGTGRVGGDGDPWEDGGSGGKGAPRQLFIARGTKV